MIQAIIIDDEKTSRDALAGLLKRYCEQVEIIGEADGVESGKKILNELKPDVVFLDIQMPDGSGFKLMEEVGEKLEAQVVFTTAFDQFAIKAIKYSALDYLLKPVLVEELMACVQKVEKIKETGDGAGNMRVFIENIKQEKNNPEKIVLATSEGVYVVKISEVVRCQSNDYYTFFYFKDGKKLLVSKTLKESEELLQDKRFFRPHKSHLVNMKYIESFDKPNTTIILNDGTRIPVSRRKRDNVVEIIRNIK